MSARAPDSPTSDESGLPRRADRRSSAGFATVGLALSVVAMTSLVLVGVGVSHSGFRFGSGFAWLGSNEKDQALLVNGVTGQGTNKVNLGGSGRLQVQMFGDHAYVVQTGPDGQRILYRLDDANLGSGSQRGVGSGQQIARSGDSAWLVDAEKGTVEPIDAEALTSQGAPLAFRPPILTATDDDGRLVVVELATASAYVVERSKVSDPIAVGEPGDVLQTSRVDDRPVVVNATRHHLDLFEHGEASRIDLPGGPGTLAIAPTGEGDVTLLRRDGNRAELITVNLDDRSVHTYPIDGGVGSGVTAPLSAPDAVFLVDSTAGTVTILDPASGRVRQRVPMNVGKGGKPDAFVKDGRLWVNDPDGERAVIIEGNGRSHDVDKYDKKVPELNQPLAPDSATNTPQPKPQPNPSPNPLPAPNNTNLPNDNSASPADPSPGRANAGTGEPQFDGSTPAPAPAPPPIVNVPGAPEQLQASPSDGSVALSWVMTNNGGAPVLGYRLVCHPDCGGPGQLDVDPGGQFEVGRLRNGTAYSFELRARNALGEGPPATARPNPVTPTADVPRAPTDVTATANRDGTVLVNWKDDAGGLTLTNFVIGAESDNPALRSAGHDITVPATRVGDGYTATINADDLGYDDDDTNDWSFAVAARAGTTASTRSPRSAPVDPYKAPAFRANTAVTATPAGGRVSLTWPTAQANGRAVTYAVQMCAGAGCNNFAPNPAVPAAGAAGTMTATVAGLTNGTTYRFRVTPSNAAGPGDPSNPAQAMPVDRPNIAVNGSRALSDTAIEVTYSVDWLGNTGTCRNTSPAPGGNIPCNGVFTRNSLAASTTYTVELCARNSAGETCAPAVGVRTNPPPGRSILIDTVTWLPQSPRAAICNGGNGAGAQPTPNSYGTGQSTRCVRDGTTVTATCEAQGHQLQSDFVNGVQIFRTTWYRLSDRGDFVSAMWVSGAPTTLGLPAC
jgi:hypothetical protein